MFVSRSGRGPRGSPHQYTQPRPQPQAYAQAPYNPSQHYFPPQNPQYSVRPPQYHVHHAQSYEQPPPYPQWHAPTPQNPYPPPQPYRNPTGPSFRSRSNYRKERQQRKETFTPLGESYTSLFQRLRQLDVLRPIEPKTPNTPPRNLDYSLRCAYCSDSPMHDTEKCWYLKRAIQELIDTNQIVVQSPEAPNINQNPLPAHAETHMIEIVHEDGEPKNSSKSVMMIRDSESNPVKAPDFAKAMPLTIEGVSEKLSTLNMKPSILVVKGPPIDVEANQEKQKLVMPGVPRKSVIILEGIANKIFEANMITFSDDELPMEGTEQNQALYLIVKCEDSAVSRLKIGTEKIHMNNVCVRGFDGGGKDYVGDIMLELSIGPVEFTMEFQVLDVAFSYNLLLGRPWIHTAKAIPSSLHQMVKFKWDRQEIVVHGDENLSAYNDTIVPFIEVKDDKGPWVYQTFKTVSVEKIPEGECILGPKLPSASVMVANEMLKNSFMPGKCMGLFLQGIAHLVCLRKSFGTFGLGFTLTGKDVKKAKNLKRKAWSLPKPVPHTSKSFVKPGVAKRPISAFTKHVVDFDEELIKRFQSLFDEVNMVEIGEGSSNADVHLVGPNVKLSNWKATPLPTRKEFCSFYAGFNDLTCIRNFQPNLKSQSNSEITIQEVECDDETKYDEEAAFEEISGELKYFKGKPKPNLNEIEAINLGDQDNVRETMISVHLELQIKEEIIKALFEYKDIFAWSYDDMPSLRIDLVVHKLSTDPAFPPVKQNLRKFKTDLSVKIKEEITKQLGAKVIRVTQYPIWLANVVPVPKKDGKTRVCVDYRDLNKASPKDNFPLPNIHILIDNCAKHEIGSFVDCYAGYHQILMDEEDGEKTTFITLWGTYCYRVISFGLKNAGETYMRAMTTIFHDMIHKEIEVYVDDVIINSKKQSDHVGDLRRFFQRLRRYNLKLNPAKCAFGVPSGKRLGFIVSRRGIELDPSKIKAIQELPPPKNKTEVMNLIGRLNYISRFIAQLTTTCEPIFKLLKKNVAVKWTDECHEAFDKIKTYLSNPPVLVPPEPGRHLIFYLTVLDNSFGCVTCCALTWVAQNLKHYLSSYTTYLITRMDPLKYIFQKPMPIGRLAKWQILLTEFDIIYVTRTAMKSQDLADHLAWNPVDEEYETLKTYFPDEEVMYVDETDHDEKPGWKLFFDGAANMKGVGIGVVLISETRHHYPVTAQL
ncbi:uncharacterized protein [Nicotiana tomentosiformis]|uniref:uncharacterized protein n=1 Tax=Nicotiana tomentosiformis TaxID=4098 RepID=UPI00388C565B